MDAHRRRGDPRRRGVSAQYVSSLPFSIAHTLNNNNNTRRLLVVGRIKDLIIRGGENLFPVQIENVLGAHPSVAEAAIVAVPDAKYGEVVGAWVVRAAGRPPITAEEARRVVAEGMNP